MPEHTTVRLSDEGKARLAALGQVYHSATAAMEAAIERLHRYHFNPESAAPDEVLAHIRRHLSVALSYIDAESERRADHPPGQAVAEAMQAAGSRM